MASCKKDADSGSQAGGRPCGDRGHCACDIYMGKENNFQRRQLLDDIVSNMVIKDKMALSNLRESFSALSKLASAAKSASDDQGWLAKRSTISEWCEGWYALVDNLRTAIRESKSV